MRIEELERRRQERLQQGGEVSTRAAHERVPRRRERARERGIEVLIRQVVGRDVEEGEQRARRERDGDERGQRRLRGYGENADAREWAHAYGRGRDGFDCHVLAIGRPGRTLKLERPVILRRPLIGDEELAVRAFEARVARGVRGQELPTEALVAMGTFDLERAAGGRVRHEPTLPAGAVRFAT